MVVNGDRLELKVSVKTEIRERRGKGIDLIMKCKTCGRQRG